jgi:putative sterol carrier protein
MPDIYTAEWYDALKETLNQSDEISKKAPRGHLKVLGHVNGDAVSPYLKDGESRWFAVDLVDGRCTSYVEMNEAPAKRDFDFTLELPASLFESVVADLVDPVKAGLKGDIKIVGDMRILIQNAELVNVLAVIYGRELETSWPKGKPPYGSA